MAQDNDDFLLNWYECDVADERQEVVAKIEKQKLNHKENHLTFTRETTIFWITSLTVVWQKVSFEFFLFHK